jgi:hypothetical protein
LKLSGSHQLLVYASDDNVLGGSEHTMKNEAEALVVASKGTGLEVTASKNEHIVMSRDQNAGRIHSKKCDNTRISFETKEEFKYFGTT